MAGLFRRARPTPGRIGVLESSGRGNVALGPTEAVKRRGQRKGNDCLPILVFEMSGIRLVQQQAMV